MFAYRILTNKYFTLSKKQIINKLFPSFSSQATVNDSLKDKRQKLMSRNLPKQKPIPGVKNIIMVASGKGGVGKTMTAVNLSLVIKLNQPELEVGILDADVFGPSVPTMMNLNDAPLLDKNNMMIPLQNYGLKCMSMGFLMNPGQPVIWRGLMVMQALEKLMRQVAWGTLDYLIIDTPPGTGDAHLSLMQNLPINAVIIVTTPQQLALQVTSRGIAMFNKLQVRVAGIVENMSHITCPHCNNEVDLYVNKIKDFCLDHKTTLLASIPLNENLTRGADNGQPVIITAPDSKIAQLYKNLAKELLIDMRNNADH